MNAFEVTLLDWIQEHLVSEFLNPVMLFITRFGDAGIFWIALSLLMLLLPKTRKLGMAMSLSLIFEALVCNLTFKPLVARVRPYDVNTAVQLLLKAPTDFSFPSGHTGASFAVVSALFFKKSRLWIPTAILSLLIAFSRLYLYVHYPTDVLAGAALGIITGWLAVVVLGLLEKELQGRKHRRQGDA